MSNIAFTMLRSILIVAFGVAVYFISYVFLEMVWKNAHDREPVFAFTFISIVLTCLVGLNYFLVGRRFKRPRHEQLAISVFILPLVFFALYIALLPRGNDFRNCRVYTKELNGGYRMFRGKEYRIEFCGLFNNVRTEYDSGDEVRLRVYSPEGELLAARYFRPLIGLPHIPITEYGDSYLMYNGEGDDYKTVLVIPPTKWEWIKARMPRILP